MTVDLSKLSPPTMVQTVDYQSILDHMRADLDQRDPSLDLQPADPAFKILEVAAYREALIRQEMNDRARGLMLAYAVGSDLDHLGVTYFANTVRFDGESDDAYRARLLIAEDGYSTAGPPGAYIYHAKSADKRVKDVSVVSPAPGTGRVTVTVLWQFAIDPVSGNIASYLDDSDPDNPPTAVSEYVKDENGQDTDILTHQAVMDAVDTKLQEVRPLTDLVSVEPAIIKEYTINANLEVYPGVDKLTVENAARKEAEAWVLAEHRLGREITVSGLHAALTVAGVHEVTLKDTGNSTDVTSNLPATEAEAPYCTSITVEAVDIQ